MEYLQSSNESSRPAIALCYNVIVHLTKNTSANIISDSICCVISLSMSVVSIYSNSLVLKVLTKHNTCKTSGNLLLISLTILELLKSSLVQTAFFLWKVLEITQCDFCYPYLLTIIGTNFCSISSFLHTCLLITVERYLGVFKPMLHRETIVRQLFKIAVLLTQLVLASFLLSAFFTSHHRIYFVGLSILLLICVTAKVILYIAICAKLQTDATMENASEIQSLGSRQAAHRRMNKTVITIILVSLVCYLPYLSVFVFISVHERTEFYTRFVIPWVYLMLFATAVLNPLVYCRNNRHMRKEVKKFSTRLLARKRNPPINETNILYVQGQRYSNQQDCDYRSKNNWTDTSKQKFKLCKVVLSLSNKLKTNTAKTSANPVETFLYEDAK